MCITIPVELTFIEKNLNLVLTTYTKHPNKQLLLIINSYLNLILKHDDVTESSEKKCAYLSMKRYWQWKSHLYA